MSKQAEHTLVSIILPTWNCADLLKEAVESVISQTYQNWELIVVNNYSTDNTPEVIKSFNDERIKIINFNNQGVIAAARNVGIVQSKGFYIAFLDSDDYWYPEKLEICLTALHEQNADVVCHGEKHFQVEADGSKTERDVHYGLKQDISFTSLLYQGNFLSTSAIVAKAEAIRSSGCFSTATDIITAEDYDLWLTLMARGARVFLIRKILGGYRIHQSSASSSLRKHLRAVRQVVLRHHQHAGGNHRFLFLYRMARLTLSSSRALFRRGDVMGSISFALESVGANIAS